MTFGLFVINLARSTQRRERILGSLAEVGLEAQIWEAVDGATLDPAHAPRYDQHERRRRFGHDLTPNEIACALSHLGCIEAAWKSGLEKVCILEDDVTVVPEFPDVLKACLALPPGVDMVKFYGLRHRRHRVVCSLTPTHSLIRPLHATCGTQGYLLDRVGMEKALAACSPLVMQIDISLDRYWENGMRLFAVSPAPLIEPGSLPSDIQAPRVDPWRADRDHRLRLRLKAHKLQDSIRRHWSNLTGGFNRLP
ncbi:glycosyltransferase family 25 protein [Pararhodospirillum photometricum]|nr:glycosyltransferase family 25 protein [Pararhodospirillum photometricum]